MAYDFQIMPGAFNWWEGNKFRIPPLGQYARPSYASALQQTASTDPAIAQALPQAIDPRIDEGVQAALSVDASVAARASEGGTAPERVRQ